MTDPQAQLDRARRDADIVRQRADRVPYRIIAAKYGISPQRCHAIWQRTVKSIPIQALVEKRIEAEEFINDQIAELIATFREQGVPPRTKAEISRVIAVWEQRRADLLGLDAPKRRELTTFDTTSWESELNAGIRELENEARAWAANNPGGTP